MKISYNWLKSLIQTDLSIEDLCDRLTMSGLEVEHVIETESIKGGLKNLIVGEVLTKAKHPNADRLNSTTVNIGNGTPLPIVCGAPNVEVGQKVIVAPVGTIIHPLEGDPFEIKKAKIRGEISEGMICAEDEISLGKSHDGILILPKETKVGTSVAELYRVETDYQIEIAIIPNRGDAVSHLGVAREIQALTGTRYRLPGTQSLDARGPVKVDIKIQNPEACPRYSGICISGVKVGESPLWLKKRLESIDQKSINNIVDITNYILHEIGQPIHAFDLDRIEGRQVIIRNAKPGEILKTLDGEERKLEDFNLVIADKSRPMALGGVLGGLESGVSEYTQNVFIECAFFNASSIRKTAKHFALNTDASYRYERGTDPNIIEYALNRTVNLIMDLAGGEISSELVDVYPNRISDKEVNINLVELNTFVGHEIPKDDVLLILQNLEIKIAANNGDNLMLMVPPYKPDVDRPVDIYEEILRIYGFDNIPIPKKVNYVPSIIDSRSPNKVKEKISNYLAALGFNEIMSNSLTSAEFYSDKEAKHAISLLNPLSSDMGILRMELMNSALHSVSYNVNRKNHDLKFFEFGKVYRSKEDGFIESQVLQLTATGRRELEHWDTSKEEITLHELKGVAYNILKKLNIPEKKFKKVISIDSPDQNSLKRHGIKQIVHSISLNWDLCLNWQNNAIDLQEIPKFPVVRRDLSLVVSNDVSYGNILEIAQNNTKGLLKEVRLFDVYEGKALEDGQKSFSVAFFLNDAEKTMTDKEIDHVMNKLITTFEKQLNALIRR